MPAPEFKERRLTLYIFTEREARALMAAAEYAIGHLALAEDPPMNMDLQRAWRLGNGMLAESDAHRSKGEPSERVQFSTTEAARQLRSA